jgi:hypothetical protein
MAAPTTTASPPQGLCAYSRTAAAAAGKLRARVVHRGRSRPGGRLGGQGRDAGVDKPIGTESDHAGEMTTCRRPVESSH